MTDAKEWKTLYEKYPDLFKDVGGDPRQTCMAWGIECDLGWYDIISAVCWRIFQHEKNIRARVEVRTNNGRENDLDDLEYVPVKFLQIKEKFGELRIYYSGGDEYVKGVVAMAEEMSYKICEVCGHPGTPSKSGWIKVLCEKHKNPSEINGDIV